MLQIDRRQFGRLSCHVARNVSSSQPPRLLVVLCHGFGAPGSDLLPLGPELARLSATVEQGAVFLFPEAPLTLAEMGMPDGRAWWPLDMLRLQLAVQQGEFRDLRNDRPPQLPRARELLLECLGAACDEFQTPLSRVVLGGFSQGAMLATDAALRLPENPAGLIVYSGALLNEEEWSELASNRAGLPVLQSHGREDPILPYETGEWLHELLTSAGLQAEFLPFAGGHTIPLEALYRTADLLQQLASE